MQHPDTAASMHNLGVALLSCSRYEEAKSLLLQALAIEEKTLGVHHHKLASTLANLGQLCCATGLNDTAERYLQRALTILTKAFGPEHAEMTFIHYGLACAHHNRNRMIASEQEFRKSLEVGKRHLSNVHPRIITILEMYAAMLRSVGRKYEAHKLEKEAKLIKENVLSRTSVAD